MDYIAIKNKGLIVPEDLMLIGSSTKRGDSTKIGMFGSGWKYALAWFLRNKCTVKIHSGKEEIVIGTKFILHRNIETYVITVNGRDTSITTEMGPKWTGWMALREVISNAIDEGEFKLEVDSSITPTDNNTVIYISMNPELQEVIANYDDYFAFNSKGINVASKIGNVIFYPKTTSNIVVYRKGIRCSDMDMNFNANVNFENININESRLADDYTIKYYIIHAILSDDMPAALFAKLMLEFSDYMLDMLSRHNITDHIRTTVEQLVVNGYEFTSVSHGKLFGVTVTDRTIKLPNDWFRDLVNKGIVEDKFRDLFDKRDPVGFIRKPAEFDISSAQHILNQFGITIVSGKFASGSSMVKVVGDKAYVSYNISRTPISLVTSVMYSCSNEELQAAITKTKAYREYKMTKERIN